MGLNLKRSQKEELIASLKKFVSLPPSINEKDRQLEQMRAYKIVKLLLKMDV